jgi:hypothetical protein
MGKFMFFGPAESQKRCFASPALSRDGELDESYHDPFHLALSSPITKSGQKVFWKKTFRIQSIVKLDPIMIILASYFDADAERIDFFQQTSNFRNKF